MVTPLGRDDSETVASRDQEIRRALGIDGDSSPGGGRTSLESSGNHRRSACGKG
jgi:hypothetical protein